MLLAKRIEDRRRDGRRNLTQSAANEFAKLNCAGGGDHRALAALEQRIIEHISEPLQRLAERRLAKPYSMPGARDVALHEQRIECHQKIEIEAG